MPKISLAIDNCFLSKRYTKPRDWMKIIKDLGIYQVEASADTELDPLYLGKEYCKRWVDEVLDCSAKEGVKVVNIYSGHGTYTTLGLSHYDREASIRMRDEWIKEQANNARKLNAGLGFFAHGFDYSCIQDSNSYNEIYELLITNLSDIARYSKEIGLKSVGVEQMYSPH